MSDPPFQWSPYWLMYRLVMRIAHRFNWHYMEPMHGIQPDNNSQIWCHWCGARYTLPRKNKPQADSKSGGGAAIAARGSSGN